MKDFIYALFILAGLAILAFIFATGLVFVFYAIEGALGIWFAGGFAILVLSILITITVLYGD